MALQHSSPATTTLTTGHHGRRAAGVFLRRPAVESRSRFRLHARKPAAGSPAAGADTEASSSSENAVLKAAWYGSELLGIAASLLRPAPEGVAGGDAEGDAAGALDSGGVVEAIKEDFARSLCYRESHDESLRGGLRIRRSSGFVQRPAALQTELRELWVSAGEVKHEAHQMGGHGGEINWALAFQLRHVVPMEAYSVSNRIHGILLRC
ncbi:unnamed protein product [Urochloa humidicola]